MPRLLMVANVAEMFRDFLIPYAHHFRAKGWEVDAMGKGVSASLDCMRAFSRAIDIDWSRDPFYPSNILKAPSTLRRHIDATGYDLVHVHTPVSGFITRFALRQRRGSLTNARRPPVIYTAHGFHFHPGGSRLKNHVYLRLEQMAGRWTDYLVVINRSDEEAARRHRIVPTDRIMYMPGIGIDLRYYSAPTVRQPDIDELRHNLHIGLESPMFLIIAEFTPGKRHEDALRAFASIRHRSAQLLLAGEGPLTERIRSSAYRLGIIDRVHFLGYRRDIPVLIRASRAVILPSEREGLPRCVMESLSLEVPLIATDIRGSRDLLEHGGGMLVPVGDSGRLAQAMTWVLDHPAEASAMGREGRRLLVTHDIHHLLDLHEYLYKRAMNTAAVQS